MSSFLLTITSTLLQFSPSKLYMQICELENTKIHDIQPSHQPILTTSTVSIVFEVTIRQKYNFTLFIRTIQNYNMPYSPCSKIHPWSFIILSRWNWTAKSWISAPCFWYYGPLSRCTVLHVFRESDSKFSRYLFFQPSAFCFVEYFVFP